jgi:hypothetical protein
MANRSRTGLEQLAAGEHRPDLAAAANGPLGRPGVVVDLDELSNSSQAEPSPQADAVPTAAAAPTSPSPDRADDAPKRSATASGEPSRAKAAPASARPKSRSRRTAPTPPGEATSAARRPAGRKKQLTPAVTTAEHRFLAVLRLDTSLPASSVLRGALAVMAHDVTLVERVVAMAKTLPPLSTREKQITMYVTTDEYRFVNMIKIDHNLPVWGVLRAAIAVMRDDDQILEAATKAARDLAAQ